MEFVSCSFDQEINGNGNVVEYFKNTIVQLKVIFNTVFANLRMTQKNKLLKI